MLKTLKITGIAIGVLLLLLISLTVALPLFIDLNDYKPQISEGVKTATGRDLTIEGDIELSVFPWIGAKLGAIQLDNAQGFGDSPFARIESAEVKVMLTPRVSGVVEAKAVTLHGLNLNLAINKDGVSNWQDLAQDGDATPAEPLSTGEHSDAAGAGLAALAIGGLHITKARVVYDDQSTSTRYAIEQLDLNTGPVSLNAPLDIDLKTRVTSSQPQAEATLTLKARIYADLVNGVEHKVELRQLDLDFDSPEFSSKGTLNLVSTINANLEKEQYTLNATQLSADVSNADIPGGKAELKLLANIEADLKQQTASIKELTLNSFGLDITGNINANNILATPDFKGDINIAPFNLKALMRQMEIEAPETADANALTKVSANLTIEGTPENITVAPLTLMLDETTLNGKLNAVFSADKPMPAVRYTLNIDEIDADRYLPPVTEETEAVAATPATAGAAAASLPTETLRALDIQGELNLNTLKIMNLSVSEIQTTLNAKDGLIRLSPLSANLYEGQYKGDMILDAQGDKPKISLNEALTNIQAGPLLQDFMDNDTLSGVGSIQVKVTAIGIEPDEAMKTLNGTANLSFTNGAVKGFNLRQLIEQAKARYKGEPVPESDGTAKTDFTALTGSFNIIDGVVHNNDLSVKSPFVRITGRGKVDLPKENIDYTVNAKIVKSEEGQGGGELDELSGIDIPVAITGLMTAPTIKVLWKEVLKAKTKQALDRKKAKLKSKLATEEAEAKARLEKERAEKKAKLEKQKAELKARIEKEKAEFDAKEEAEKERIKQELEQKAKDKLKNLFGR